MTQDKSQLIERVVARLADNKALLERFLERPSEVAAEVAGAPVDQDTLDAIGQKLHEAFSEKKPASLEDAELDQATAAGFYWSNIASFRPTIGRNIGGSFTAAITMM